MFLGTVCTPLVVNRWGRYVTATGALVAAAVVQIAGAGLVLPMLVGCGFLLGVAGQVIKIVRRQRDPAGRRRRARGQVFAVQDSLFWVAFIAAITLAAAVIPADGYSPLAVAGSVIYPAGLAVHALPSGRRGVRNRLCRWLPPNRSSTTCAPRVTPRTASSGAARRRLGPGHAGAGWTIAHQIAHLLWTDEVALTSITDEPGFSDVLAAAAQNPAGFVDDAADELATLAPEELLARWRATRAPLHDALRSVPADRKLPGSVRR